ncbi:MAG: peptide ABC transporter permease [Pseudomonadota bacterium]|nr:MAG: peptide ABC transporter permease [Pseudomonadota bacterium]
MSPHTTFHTRNARFIHAPPQAIHLFHQGEFVGPFVYGYDYKLDMKTLKRAFTVNKDKVHPIRFLCRGDSYRFWGTFESNVHLFCPANQTLTFTKTGAEPKVSNKDGTLFLFGTDRLGRDVLSRKHLWLTDFTDHRIDRHRLQLRARHRDRRAGGLLRGWVDNIVQRVIEILRSFPEIPLWMALSAVLPVTWSPLLIFFGITMILALLDWTGLARAVRSKLMALREEDYCTAAQLMGAKPGRVIGRHLLPGFMSHLIASASLSIPGMILGETALSFLGLGLRPPITSWGVLLNEAQNINVVALYPWLMLPVVPVIIIILAFNFFGDGLRDAADPYK